MAEDLVTRRELAKSIVAGAGISLLSADLPCEGQQPAADPAAEAPLSPVDAQMAWLLDRYPTGHLTAEEIAEIRQDVQRKLQQSNLLRQYPLRPEESPGLVFAAYRAPDNE